ncbi:MAG: DUF4390 domain-containing protein [Steroidobacteraceae bacterium]
MISSLCLLLFGLLSGFTVLAQSSSDDIQIRSPYLKPDGNVYALNARLLFDVPLSVEQAIHDGAVLNMELQLRVSHERRWWRDAVQAELQQRYQLLYHGVSERFVVRNLNSGAQSSFATFAEAVATLKQIEDLPVLDKSLVGTASDRVISLRVHLEERSIPRALGMLLFWVDDFSLTSDWYTWPLKP